ncbi:hypothetical protein BHM03_00055721 [Ensete ventricosum]|nr:hypothetical protein BHM03_00055721 [Ensete ventricosum]
MREVGDDDIGNPLQALETEGIMAGFGPLQEVNRGAGHQQRKHRPFLIRPATPALKNPLLPKGSSSLLFWQSSSYSVVLPLLLPLGEEWEMEEITVGKSRFKRVCVFCGSSTGKRNCYQDAAVELGKELVALTVSTFVARKVDLVYGGGSVGLMGLVSEAVHTGGGHVIGSVQPSL